MNKVLKEITICILVVFIIFLGIVHSDDANRIAELENQIEILKTESEEPKVYTVNEVQIGSDLISTDEQLQIYTEASSYLVASPLLNHYHTYTRGDIMVYEVWVDGVTSSNINKYDETLEKIINPLCDGLVAIWEKRGYNKGAEVVVVDEENTECVVYVATNGETTYNLADF